MSIEDMDTWFHYKEWLLELVDSIDSNYDRLFSKLHDLEFIPIISRDSNREGDGLALREDFLSSIGFDFDSFEDLRCSVLEMLIALAIRVDNEWIGDPADPDPGAFFWEMLENLGLHRYDDQHYNDEKVTKIVRIWLERRFDRDGNRSIFPLKQPHRDQRNVEIWSQMLTYISENY